MYIYWYTVISIILQTQREQDIYKFASLIQSVTNRMSSFQPVFSSNGVNQQPSEQTNDVHSFSANEVSPFVPSAELSEQSNSDFSFVDQFVEKWVCQKYFRA